MSRIPYTSANELRTNLHKQAAFKAEALKKAVDPAILARWTEQALARAKETGLLMTDRQLADYRAGRAFDIGDKARYIGPTRIETVGNDEIERPHGQRGTITNVIKQADADIITFQPTPAHPDDHIVELVIRTDTKGFLDLERASD